jgi:hypothetical protein
LQRERACERLQARLSLLMFIVGFNLQSGSFIAGPRLPDLAADLGISGFIAGLLAAIAHLMRDRRAVPGWEVSWSLRPDRTLGIGRGIVGLAGTQHGMMPASLVKLVLTVVVFLVAPMEGSR